MTLLASALAELAEVMRCPRVALALLASATVFFSAADAGQLFVATTLAVAVDPTDLVATVDAAAELETPLAAVSCAVELAAEGA